MARCALLYPNIGLDLAAKLAGAEVAWAMDIDGTVIDRMLRLNHKDLPFYGDPTAFPFRMTDAELKCDFWVTGNALAATFALRKVSHRDVLPKFVVAKAGTLIELPALLRAWHECGFFERIEWASEDARMHGTPINEKQVYMIGRLTGAAPLTFGQPAEIARPKLVADYWVDGAWKTGPAFLNPQTDSGDNTSYIQALRRGAIADAAKAVMLRLAVQTGGSNDQAVVGKQFASLCVDAGRTVIAKADDVGGIQMLLDNSPEQFFEVWPLNGFRDDSGRLFPLIREYPPADQPSMPLFTSGTRNTKYIMAALGIPYTYVPM